MSLGRPTRSIRLLQTDRESEDRLRDKRRSSADFLKVLYFFFLVGYLNKCYFQGSKFKFGFGSTCATRCKFLGAQLKILGAQPIMLGASISKQEVKSLTVPRLFVIFSLLLQPCD